MMTDSKPLNCPCCGSTATVEPHLIDAGCTIGEQTWPDWWTASVNCDKCALQFVGGGDTEEEAVEDALDGWNRRAAVTDEQFARAIHDGRTWVCVEEALESDALTPIKGFTRNDIFRDAMHEYGEWMERATKLMRDLWALTDEMFRFKVSPSINTMAEFEERLEEFGVGGNDD
jgi:hypothetical protein